jgi:hypothetical protein
MLDSPLRIPVSLLLRSESRSVIITEIFFAQGDLPWLPVRSKAVRVWGRLTVRRDGGSLSMEWIEYLVVTPRPSDRPLVDLDRGHCGGCFVRR